MEKFLFFGLFFRIYFFICFFSCLVLILDFNVYKYLKSVFDGGRFDKLLILFGMLFDEIVKFKSIDCKCCILLFFKWRGLIIFLL